MARYHVLEFIRTSQQHMEPANLKDFLKHFVLVTALPHNNMTD